jgi:2,4-dienoyl-CoA reductase-like NADH-dependent reductase (Old Yellow Enzyme family)
VRLLVGHQNHFALNRDHHERLGPDRKGPDLKKAFGGVYIVNESFDEKTAEDVLAESEADAVAFGKLFIANPDLGRRLREDAPLNALDSATLYGGDARGYTDYPVMV